MSEKVKKLKESLLQVRPRVSTERVKILFESYRETEGAPAVIRRAKFFRRFCNEKALYMDENPIMGNQTEYRVGVFLMPEWSCRWMKKEEAFRSYLAHDMEEVDEETREWMHRAADYWQDKCLFNRAKEAWEQKYPGLSRDDMGRACIWLEAHAQPKGTINVDYGKVLSKGLKGVIQEAREEMAKLPFGSIEGLRKREFLEGVVMCCSGVIELAHRYANLTGEMAQSEADPGRKKELERISETCAWVPENPARSFCEAVQSYWFVHLGAVMEQSPVAISPGRFSLYMHPFYKKDEEEGRITEAEAVELLQLLFIKHMELQVLFPNVFFRSNQAHTGQNMSLGGLTRDGKDATNKLDFLVLEAQKHLQLLQPTLSVMYHDRLPEEFLVKAAEVVQTGLGMPAWINNDLCIQRVLSPDIGASLEDARDVCAWGCVHGRVSHANDNFYEGPINMTEMLLLAMNNGRGTYRLAKQLGPQTGEAEEFQAYGQLHEAVYKQLEYFVPMFHDSEQIAHALHAELLPLPFTSALVDDCIQRGLDITAGGARYSQTGIGPIGTINLANSLAAIKKLVFEEKRITMRQLKEALKANFEGYEDIHKMLLEAPKYGNEDEYVDQIAREWYDIFHGIHQKCNGGHDHIGHNVKPYAYSVSLHVNLGTGTGASPDGRKAGIALTDATVSASPGTDTSGPSALINSATRVLDTLKYSSGQLNMRFHPTVLKDISGRRKLISLIKTYMDLGGHHIQFNVVSGETLRAAQLHPENYRDLIVRVAGFSAFFINLDRDVQDEIIKRTEVEL